MVNCFELAESGRTRVVLYLCHCSDQVDEDDWSVTDCPCVVTGVNVEGFMRAHLEFCPVIHEESHAT